MSWTVGRRIAIGYASVLLLLAVVAAVGVSSLTRTVSVFDQALEHQEKYLLAVGTATGAIDSATEGFLRYLVTSEADAVKLWESGVERARRSMIQLRDEAGTESRAGWGEALALLDAWEQGCKLSMSAQAAGHREEALRLRAEQVTPARKKRDAVVEGLVESQRARTRELTQSAVAAAERAAWTMLLVAGFALVIGATIAATLTRSITRPLDDAIGALASACAEILAATTQQASGAAEEAAAVQETSTTADELKQTAQVSTQKARAVTDAVQRTAQVSQDGRRAVEESVKGMRDTKARMEVIAERVLVLSERAQAIGEIIAAVNDLAEQSNLLAVNAAIEAAKAGEQGRGFAVVASEVKSLAEQSKQATSQVRAILGEIQRATQATVMAAEQGVKASETGVGVASHAGDAIGMLVESLAESAQAAQQIAASAQQQSAGTEQIATAMRNIQQASTQNLASTRQVERAALDLNELAARLKTLVVAGAHAPRQTKT